MALYKEHATLAMDDGFRTRVRAAVIQYALWVMENQQITNKITRAKVQLAREIVDTAGMGVLEQFSWTVAANGTVLQKYADNGVLEDVPDGDIQYVVEQDAWDEVAGKYIEVPAVPKSGGAASDG